MYRFNRPVYFVNECAANSDLTQVVSGVDPCTESSVNEARADPDTGSSLEPRLSVLNSPKLRDKIQNRKPGFRAMQVVSK